VVLDWQGKSAAGLEVRAKAMAAIINEHGVALLALGLADQLAKREQDLTTMFTSFGFGKGKLDSQLVGSWRLLSTYSISNDSPFETTSSKARMVSDTNSVMRLAADGTWSRTDTTHTIALGAGVGLESKDRKVRQGKWNAGGGALYLAGDDDSWDDFKYQVTGSAGARQLKLVSGSRGQIWSEVSQ